MTRVVFDIETVGDDFEALDAHRQEYLLQWADTEQEQQKVKEDLGFYPLTGSIVTIGLLNPDTLKGVVYFQAPGDAQQEPLDEDGVRYEAGSEEEILQKFWSVIASYDEFITFNGRTFDCPYIMVRSAINRVKPTRNLMPNRYSGPHIDLLDQLTFFGASRRRFSLDMWCRSLGIQSPKEQGVSGADVKRLYEEGRHLDIARYCARDLLATKELYELWRDYISYRGR